MIISLVLFVIVMILAAYVANTNLTVITINLLGYPLRGASGLLLVGSLGVGVLMGVLFMLPALLSRSWSLIRHRRKLQDLQDEMKRNYPREETDEE
jgi:uncharacterized membrane protein